MFRRLLLLALFLAGAWWYWTRWRPAHNYRVLSARLDRAIAAQLTARGIVDKDIVSQWHKERSQWGIVWIETDRRIQVFPQRFQSVLDGLDAAIKRRGCEVSRREETRSQAVLEISKGPFLMQRIVLVPPQAVVAEPPRVALVIDDVAYDPAPMDRYAELNIPLTFAILPRDKNSRALAEKAHSMRFAVILHLPMQPQDLAHNNPGEAALYLRMTPQQLHEQFEKDVVSVPDIEGINNHMGSAFTENAAKMRLVLKWVKEKHLFFLDSRTTTRSVVPKVAREVGVPCLANETFLDNQDDAMAIEHQLERVLQLALHHKSTIAIGHYRRKHLAEALAKKIPEFQARGIEWVTLPSLYEHFGH